MQIGSQINIRGSWGSPALVHAHSLLVDPDLSFPVDSIKVHEDFAAVANRGPAGRQTEGAPVECAQNANIKGRWHTYSITEYSVIDTGPLMQSC